MLTTTARTGPPHCHCTAGPPASGDGELLVEVAHGERVGRGRQSLPCPAHVLEANLNALASSERESLLQGAARSVDVTLPGLRSGHVAQQRGPLVHQPLVELRQGLTV